MNYVSLHKPWQSWGLDQAFQILFQPPPSSPLPSCRAIPLLPPTSWQDFPSPAVCLVCSLLLGLERERDFLETLLSPGRELAAGRLPGAAFHARGFALRIIRFDCAGRGRVSGRRQSHEGLLKVIPIFFPYAVWTPSHPSWEVILI